jgi:hypothetical protein
MKNSVAENLTVVESPETQEEGAPFVMAPGPHPLDVAAEDIGEDSNLFAQDETPLHEIADEIEENAYREDLEEARDLQIIKGSLSGQRGLNGRLYHINKSGDEVRYYSIKDIGKHVKDIEDYIANLIEENEAWPGGTWKIKICTAKTGKVKGIATLRFPDKPKPASPAQSDSLIATTALKQTADMQDQVLRLAQATQGSNKDSIEEMTKMLALVQAINPPKQQSNEVLTTLITAGMPVVLQLIQNMSKASKEPPNIVEQLAALKELASDKPEASFNTALAMITKMMDAVHGMQPPSGNPWQEAIKHIMPHAAEAVGNVAGGLREALQLKREQLALQAQAFEARRLPPGSGVSTETMPVSSQTKQPEDTAQMHPTFKAIYEAVLSNNVNFYPDLETIIKANLDNDGEIINGMVDGNITPEVFVTDFIAKVGTFVPQFAAPELKPKMVEYMSGFVLYKLRELEATQFVTRCDTCQGEDIAFDSEEDYNTDEQGGICGRDGCQGKLQPIVAVSSEVKEEELKESSVSEEAGGNNGSGPPETAEKGAIET